MWVHTPRSALITILYAKCHRPQGSSWPRRGRLMFASPCDDITFLVNYIMLRRSAAAVLFDPSKPTPSSDRSLQGQIWGAEVCKQDLCCRRLLLPWSRPKATRGHYTLWHI